MTSKSSRRESALRLPDWQQAIYQRCVHPAGTPIPWHASDEDGSLADRFEKVARLVPDRLAVQSEDGSLTYRELNEAANRIGHAIVALQSDVGVPIALLCSKGVGICVSAFATLKAGHFLTALDPTYARNQLDHIVRDSQTNVILTDSQNYQLANELVGGRAHVLDIESIGLGGPIDNVGKQKRGDATCVLVYTSGSAGTPKGLVHSNRQYLHTQILDLYNICREDRIALLFAVSTTPALVTIWDAVLNGATLVPFDVKAKGSVSIAPRLREQKITLLKMASPLFRAFVDTLDEDSVFPVVRALTLQSQTVLASDFEHYKRRFASDCIFVTKLSSTEQGGFGNSVYYLDHACEVTTATVPVGYAYDPEKERYLLDDDGTEVSPGEIGEIVVKSRYHSPGYWGDAERTAATFLPDPSGTDKTIFHTGDMGRVQPDGCLEVVGRKDFMVKIRGNRVELPGIESALMQHESIKEAVVVAKEDAAGNRRLAAFIVPAGAQGVSPLDLRSYLAERLPSFAVPSYIVPLAALPQLPGGKVDRLSLPNPASMRPELDTEYQRPWSDIELELSTIWTEVLGIDRVGVNDDFLELGGDSLLAASLLAKAQKLFEREISLATLIKANTVAKMAALLSGEPLATRASSLVPIQPNGDRPPFFCVPGVGGHVYQLANLARQLGQEQPFYGLEPPGRDGEQPALDRIEDMAALFIREMRTLQPKGPYYIGAYSWGSNVALEMGQQLLRAGEETAALVLFDSSYSGEGDKVRTSGRRTKAMRSLLRALATRTRVRALFSSSARETLEHRGWRDRERSPVWAANIRAGRSYLKKAYPGKITYFRSAEGKPGAREDARDGWEKLALEGMDVHEVPGDHYTMLQEPHVAVLATKLARTLDSAQASESVAVSSGVEAHARTS